MVRPKVREGSPAVAFMKQVGYKPGAKKTHVKSHLFGIFRKRPLNSELCLSLYSHAGGNLKLA